MESWPVRHHRPERRRDPMRSSRVSSLPPKTLSVTGEGCYLTLTACSDPEGTENQAKASAVRRLKLVVSTAPAEFSRFRKVWNDYIVKLQEANRKNMIDS